MIVYMETICTVCGASWDCEHQRDGEPIHVESSSPEDAALLVGVPDGSRVQLYGRGCDLLLSLVATPAVFYLMRRIVHGEGPAQ